MTDDDLKKETANPDAVAEEKKPDVATEAAAEGKEPEAATDAEGKAPDEKPEEKPEEVYTGKEVTTSIIYDERTMKYFNVYQTVVRRKLPVWYFVMGIICFGLCGYVLYQAIRTYQKTPEKNFPGNIIFSLIFLAFGIYLFIQGFRFEHLIDKVIRKHFQSHTPVRQNIKIREDKIFLLPNDPNGQVYGFDWLSVGRIDEVDAFFFLYLSMKNLSSAPIIISKDPAMIVEGDFETLLQIIDEKIKTKPYRLYNKKFMRYPIPYVERENEANVVSADEVKAPDTNNENQESSQESGQENRDDKPQE